MTGAEKLLQKNSIELGKLIRKLILKRNGVVTINIGENGFGGSQVRNLLGQLNYVLKRYGNSCKIIEIRVNNFLPKDKLSYIILEIVIYMLVKSYKKKVYFFANKAVRNINTCGLKDSLLYDMLSRKIDCEEYVQNFEKANRVKSSSFRRIIKHDDKRAISHLMRDIKTFLKRWEIEKDDCSRISKIVSELADNACEHAESECFIDVDISNMYKKEGEDNEYYSVSICVLNFSDILLGEQVKKKIVSNQFQMSERYEGITHAYNSHKNFFDNRYTEDHFFILASFQDEISGRCEESNTGGKGLTELVREIEKCVDEYECYVLTGNSVIFFHPDCLEIDNDGWISFNVEKDFTNHQPDGKIISYSDTDLGGTGYNLSLIYKRSL